MVASGAVHQKLQGHVSLAPESFGTLASFEILVERYLDFFDSNFAISHENLPPEFL